MTQTVGVAQFVDRLLDRALHQNRRVRRQTVEFFAQAVQGNQCALPAELGFSEHEGQDRNKQVRLRDAEQADRGTFHFGRQLPQDRRGPVLAPFRVEKGGGVERRAEHTAGKPEDGRQARREGVQKLQPHRVAHGLKADRAGSGRKAVHFKP